MHLFQENKHFNVDEHIKTY